MKRTSMISSLIATLLMSVVVLAHSADVKKTNGMLVSASGMTVYTFDKDVADNGKSACSGACTGLWPAVVATDTNLKAPYGSIKRDDGTMQLTYKGKPLYMYSGDKKPGDATGDNFKDIWHAAKE
jgi:predicted lipoprotein with Yx(FWY)xxD motif